ncbi:hypothetical protein HK104_001073, partial [Borealophlyctis nickersoniae]
MLRSATVVIPLHHTAPAAHLARIIDVGKPSCIIASSHLRVPLLQGLAASADPSCVRFIVLYDDDHSAYALRRDNDSSPSPTAFKCPPIVSATTVYTDATKYSKVPYPTMRPTDTAILLPTSGTTGLPKLTILPSSLLRMASDEHNLLVMYAHETFRQSLDVMSQGGRIGVWSGSADRIEEDTKILRPTIFGATPSFFNALYHQFRVEVSKLKAVEPDTPVDDIERRLQATWRKRQIFGNRCKILVVGGARTSEEVKTWMWDALGAVVVIDGYGTTETGSIARAGDVHKVTTLILRDVPELGYTTADVPHPRGEILASTNRLTPGYFGDEAATAAAFVEIDGVRYFKTGDIGEMVEGKVKVIDRMGSVFKLSQGIFVAPEMLEGIYRGSELVEQIFVWGNSQMQGVAAVVVPSTLLVERIGKETGTTSLTRTQMCADETLKAHAVDILSRELRKFGADKGLKAWEIPQRIVVESEPFDIWNGLLSSIGKMRRPALIQKYRGVLSDVEDPTPLIISKTANVEDGGICLGLRTILHDTIPNLPSNISPSDSLASLGADSFALARLASAIQTRFGVSIPLATLVRLPTLHDLQLAMFGTRSGEMTTKINWNEEVEKAWALVEENIAKPTPSIEDPPFEPGVLLTGATGFLGAHLLSVLSSPRYGSSPIYCIVRGPNPSARITSALSYYSLGPPSPRVIPLEGDISQPYLGLPLSTYTSLTQSVTHIYHNAALVNGVLPYESHHPPNVIGTANILSLALASPHPPRVCYVSTASVLASSGIVSETPDVPPTHLNSLGGYPQSKWVAQHLIHRAVSRRGLTGCVVRPGTIAGPATGGVCNPKDSIVLLTTGLKSLGVWCPSVLPTSVLMAPVDWVSAAIAQLGVSGTGVYHLVGTTPLPLRDVVDALGGVREVSEQEFLAAVADVGEGHPLFHYK